MTADKIPATAVVRVSIGTFEPPVFPEAEKMNIAIGEYLIPAIKQLPGLISYFATTSPISSQVIHVSVWESNEAAEQMSRLKEMTVRAAADAEKANVHFGNIVNYPVNWSI
ncbi:hypothetical protein [Streptacidiphilus sp. EB129]|uniref:hypothetical protein n=1 Tax=Streptacidiphilus sp. EB129 TaxID=3156262 RepID=UPI0035185C34